MADKQKRRSTTIVEGGRRKEWRRRLVNVPIERASTILFDNVADLESNAPGLGIYRYGLLVTDSVYGPTRKFCDTILKRFGISTRYFDPLVGADIAGLIGDKTRAI